MFRLAVAVVLVLGLLGCGSDRESVMPDVVGQRLDVALSDIKDAGFKKEVEVVGGGVLGIIDESNWQVCDQKPAVGQAVATPWLAVERSCSDDAPEPATSPTETEAAPTEQPAQEPTQAPEEAEPNSAPTVSEAEELLTVENNEDLAALLAIEDYEVSEAFAAKYAGKTIKFDGNIAYMAPHGDYDTRYDLLITAGDYSETSQTGPSFKFRDVNVGDLNLTGSNNSDSIGMRDNLRVTALVKEFNPNTGLFFLEPVSTEFR